MHPDGEFIGRLYDAFDKGDLETIQNAIADDAVLEVAGRGSIAGTYKGRDEILGLLGDLVSRSDGTFKSKVHDILANDEHVVVLSHSTAERDGKKLDEPGVEVFHVRDGKIAEAYFTGMRIIEFNEFFA